MQELLSQRVLASGSYRSRDGRTPISFGVGGLVCEWRAETNGDARDLCLHFAFTMNNAPCAGVACPGDQNVLAAAVRITYGAGAAVNVVEMDAQPGVYQMPACDYMRVEFVSLSLDLRIVASAAVVQGQNPFASPPTWTGFWGKLGALWAAGIPAFRDAQAPMQARSVELYAWSVLAVPAWAKLTPRNSAFDPTVTPGQAYYFASDGTGTPAFPARLVNSMDANDTPVPGTATAGLGYWFTVSASDNTVVQATFNLSL